MNTYTGRVLYPSNFGVPAPLDLAVQLGRIPRFAGATRIWPWTVMHHLLAGLRVLVRLREGEYGYRRVTPETILAWLIHEADECATGDTPTTWKGAEQRKHCDKLIERTALVYAGPWVRNMLEDDGSLVKKLDEAMLVAEMFEVMRPEVLRASGYDTMQVMVESELLAMARTAVKVTRTEYFTCDDTGREESPGSVAYLEALGQYGARLDYFSKEEGGTGG